MSDIKSTQIEKTEDGIRLSHSICGYPYCMLDVSARRVLHAASTVYHLNKSGNWDKLLTGASFEPGEVYWSNDALQLSEVSDVDTGDILDSIFALQKAVARLTESVHANAVKQVEKPTTSGLQVQVKDLESRIVAMGKDIKESLEAAESRQVENLRKQTNTLLLINEQVEEMKKERATIQNAHATLLNLIEREVSGFRKQVRTEGSRIMDILHGLNKPTDKQALRHVMAELGQMQNSMAREFAHLEQRLIRQHDNKPAGPAKGTELPDMISSADAAKILKCAGIARYEKQGLLTPVRLGKKKLYNRKDVEQLMLDLLSGKIVPAPSTQAVPEHKRPEGEVAAV